MGEIPADSPARLTRWFSYVLDDAVRVPGTTIRFGIDPVLSFVPFAGTAVGATFGLVVLGDAVRLRAPVSVVARMVFNTVLDWALGLVPVVGALFDVAYRSNRKNLKLLHRTIANREQVRTASVRYWVGIVAMAVVMLAVIIGVPVAALLWLNHLVTGR